MQAATAMDAGPIGRSKALDDSLARAHQLAVAQGHASVTLEHLLFALQDDPDGQAILASSGVNRDSLGADVSAYVGRLSETAAAPSGAAPQPGADLLRILQLAAMAARQSQRRLMDGAIVLAAIIGDGKSPAAGMLKAQGLTFDTVIQVIAQQGTERQQQVAAPPVRATLPAPEPVPAQTPPAPEPPAARVARVPDAPSADVMLADVRARVKKSEPATVPIKVAAPKSMRVEAPAAVVAAPVPAPVAEAPETVKPVPAPVAVPAEVPAASPPASTAPAPTPAPPAPPAAPTAVDAAPALAQLRRPTAAAPHSAPLPPMPQAGAVLPPPLPLANGSGRPPLPAATLPRPPVPETPPPPTAPPLVAPIPVQPVAPEPRPLQAAVPGPTPPSLIAAHPVLPVLPPVATPIAAQPLPQGPVKAVDVVAAASGLPAVMRLGTPVLVEVRIPRDQIDVPRRRGHQMMGQTMAPGGDPPIYRIVSVRLGTGGVSGLAIEPRSPETIWIGMGRDVDANDFVWQFVVTPTRAGRFAVTLGVAGRTVSPYGVAGDGMPQSETFAVVVKRASGQRVKSLLTGLTLFAFGAATAVLAGGPILAAAKTLLARLIK